MSRIVAAVKTTWTSDDDDADPLRSAPPEVIGAGEVDKDEEVEKDEEFDESDFDDDFDDEFDDELDEELEHDLAEKFAEDGVETVAPNKEGLTDADEDEEAVEEDEK